MYWVSRFSTSIETYFGEKLLCGFLYNDYEWVLDKNTADLVLGIQWRTYMGKTLISPTLNALSEVVLAIFLLGVLLVIQPVISLLVLVLLGGVGYFIYFKISSWLDITARRCRDFKQNIHKNVTKAIHGIKDVKISRTIDFFIQEFNDNALPFTRYFASLQFLGQAPTLIFESVGFIMLMGVLCFMLLVMQESLAIITGTLALLAVTVWRVLPALNRVVGAVTNIRNGLPYIAAELDYLEQIERQSVKNKPDKTIELIGFNRKIDLHDVVFRYKSNDMPVLRDFSLCIKKYETFGIIGPSGSGKSTLVDLIIGLLSPDKGSVCVDGIEITRSNFEAWIHHIGYVSQSPYIFDGSLADNVAFGVPVAEINRERVLQSCHMAAMDFLKDLSQGIDTHIGERGIRLSGGQQQRVAIARALYRKPDVLIFDEATSALDSKSEKAILETIYSFKGKVTLIIIAHRLSTVKQCNKVAWLEKGVLRDVGVPEVILPTYKQEMSKNGGNVINA